MQKLIEAQKAYLKGDISVYAFANIQADVILELAEIIFNRIKDIENIKERLKELE